MKKVTGNFAVLLQGFFTVRLMQQKQASSCTLQSYRDAFRLLLRFLKGRLNKLPSELQLADIDAPVIAEFLKDMENNRKICARSRNLRLTAIKSFFRYAALEVPCHSAQIQRVLAIPSKRYERRVIEYLTQEEVMALLAAPDQSTWYGRRDHALLLVAVHTGLRLSELTSLRKEDVSLGTGAHVRVCGKGRKERCTPLSKETTNILKAWLKEPAKNDTTILFPNGNGDRLSNDGVQYLLRKYAFVASTKCPSLGTKRLSPHVLRHTTAMELLQAGVDRAVIALWLGHESLETTQIYLHANLALKEQALARTTMPKGKLKKYCPDDQLLAFLTSL